MNYWFNLIENLRGSLEFLEKFQTKKKTRSCIFQCRETGRVVNSININITPSNIVDLILNIE